MGSYEDLRAVKMLLDASDKTRPREENRTQELILFGASLEALRDVKEKVERIHERLALMDNKNEKEVKEVKKEEKSLLHQIQELSPKEKEALLELLKPKEEEAEQYYNAEPLLQSRFGPVESVASRKKSVIKETIQKYGKITSSQLSRLIGLSRTRCNEYLKELEISGELTAFTDDKKRYYQLKN